MDSMTDLLTINATIILIVNDQFSTTDFRLSKVASHFLTLYIPGAERNGSVGANAHASLYTGHLRCAVSCVYLPSLLRGNGGQR